MPVHRAIGIGNVLCTSIGFTHHVQCGHLIVIGAEIGVEVTQTKLAVERQKLMLAEVRILRLKNDEIVCIDLLSHICQLIVRQQPARIQAEHLRWPGLSADFEFVVTPLLVGDLVFQQVGRVFIAMVEQGLHIV